MAEAEPSLVRFGIVGCANIARKVSRAILLSPNSTIVAVGSRSQEKATAFARDNGFPPSARAYGSYDAVLDDPEVDAVYIPLPTSLHLRWAVLAAQKKKHVLLEKPVALNVGELDKILAACESSGVQYMDATMWMHHPRTAEMKAFINDSQRFGRLKAVHSIFSYNSGPDFLNNDIRVKPDLDALGALGDTGWYCIRAILWAAGYQLPKTVTALRDAEFNEAGVILSCGASLLFHDGPTEHIVATDLPQEAMMVKEFSSLVEKIKVHGCETDKIWPTISRKTQAVVDAVKSSIEKGFEPVEVTY
ncbi:Glyceraldehyde-3-phosphate dehydrogenase-like family protein [Striga hermonthica]|uniref:Glyceraldehyde-3-phosphate dehydrogenase-like family protein n=1 Tax=Striga hermonthica TaxID=68872 RepID=A0A9N7NGD3_STRHE|nr:Glyceraldehyde-3-phosphate dehydrogenase-like family protein [Striga hermonthica]